MKTKRPIDCRTENEICELQTSVHELKDFWILTDGYTVSLTEQKTGDSPAQKISIPKRQFDALIGWYMKDQPIKERATTKD